MLKILFDLLTDTLKEKYKDDINAIILEGIETSIEDLTNLKELPINYSSLKRIRSFDERIAGLKEQKKQLLRNM